MGRCYNYEKKKYLGGDLAALMEFLAVFGRTIVYLVNFVYLILSLSADLFGDAWGYGGVDASSGTAALMEIVRTSGSLVRTAFLCQDLK
jgi:hypothetical protein